MRRRFFGKRKGEYLTIEAIDDVTFTFSNRFWYSNGESWEYNSGGTELSIPAGAFMMLKSDLSTDSYSIGKFVINGACNLSGNCLSLLHLDNARDVNYMGSHNFSNLFKDCTSIISVSKDFLPATTLMSYCYHCMFSGCSSLTAAPELPATTLAENCYESMFYGCTNLNYIKMLATDISARRCLNDWVSGVASSGTFVKNIDATWNVTGEDGIPKGWTVQNA